MSNEDQERNAVVLDAQSWRRLIFRGGLHDRGY